MYNSLKESSGGLFVKKLAVISLIVSIVFFLTACVQDPFEEYENFVNDLDISARIEDAINSANQGDTSPFFVSEVNALLEDLQTFDQTDEQAHSINQFYSDSVKDVLSAIDARKAGKIEGDDGTIAKLNDAMDLFRQGQDQYSILLVQYNHKNNRPQ
jgi:hypothetical protein